MQKGGGGITGRGDPRNLGEPTSCGSGSICHKHPLPRQILALPPEW